MAIAEGMFPAGKTHFIASEFVLVFNQIMFPSQMWRLDVKLNINN